MPKSNPLQPSALSLQSFPTWLTVRNEGDITEMIISGTIGRSWYDDSGTTSKEFREKFSNVPAGQKVRVLINSEGGSVADALEIYNIIQSRKADVTTINFGYALSSASVILCAGGRVIIPKSSITMIHEPWSMTVGDESDHLKAAQMLSKHGDTIADIYARKTGKSSAEMREAMRSEMWFTGAEAAEYGFGETDPEETDEEELVENRVRGLDLSPFKNVPQNILERISGLGSRVLGLESDPKTPRPQILNPRPQIRISAPALAASGGTTNKPGAAGNAQTMDKTKILAALKARGVELAEDASEETILAAFEKLSPQDPSSDIQDANEVKALREQLESERRVRITAEVKRRGENRIENKLLKRYIEMAMKDETGTYELIDAMALQRPGGDPLGISSSGVAENRIEEIKNERDPFKRFATLRAEWNEIIAQTLVNESRRGQAAYGPSSGGNGQRLYPVASNTYSATLITQFLLDGAVTKLQNRWAPLKVFTKDYSQDRYKPRATAQLKFVTAGGTTQKNATNFEAGDATISNVQIAVDQYTTAFHVTNDELNSGLRMDNLVDIKTAECADNILKVAFSPLATGSFTTNAAIVRAAAAFSFSDMATASGLLKKSPIKYAVLDGEYSARIENQPVFYQATGTMNGSSDGWKRFGWDGVFTNSNWSGTHSGANDQNIRGLFCNPQVMGAVAGLPLTPPTIPGAVLQDSTITVPEVDVSIAAYSWFSLSTRTMWMSYDLMFGSSLLDESAGVLLTSA